MSDLITKADLEGRVGAGEVKRYSKNSDANVDSAIARAVSRMRSEVVKIYTPLSWDALTSETLPGVAAIHLISDALDLLSSGSNRPDEIATKAEEARLFRIRIAKGEERGLFEGVLTRARKNRVRGTSPESNYFRDDEEC